MKKFTTYEDWKYCITELCGIPLTKDFIEKRISELNDPNDFKIQKFVNTWGETHRKKVVGWFEQARQEFVV